MQQPFFFFGFPVDTQYQTALSQLDRKIYCVFVRPEGEESYLQEYTHGSQLYLGKKLGTLIECTTLELLQVNIYSLLKKLVPGYPYEAIPLQLLPLVANSAEER